MEEEMKLHTSGADQVFSTGAKRDTGIGKGAPYMIPPLALRRLAKHFEIGGKTHGDLNFMKGMPLARLYDSAWRHLLDWSEGNDKEDALAAALWNIVIAMWTEEEIKQGRLPQELDNLPYKKNG